MKLAGNYSFEAPLDVVWAALFDPEVLARTLPGCDRLDRDGDRFTGELNVKMGPVQGKFQGKVDLSDVVERAGYTMVVDGRGPAGFVKATAKIALSAEGEATRIDYDSDVNVGGRIASVGQRLIDASSKAIVKQSLEGLHAQVKALSAARSASDAPPASEAPAQGDPATAEGGGNEVGAGHPALPAKTPPGASSGSRETPPAGVSQAAFAMGVAREVTKELLPLRTVIAIALCALALGLWIWLF